MPTFPDLVICEHCDAVCQRIALAPGEMARCPTCAAVLWRASGLTVDRWLALTVAAAILFVIANTSPVISINFRGLHNQTTLWQSAAALSHGPWGPIAVPTAMTIIIVPFLQIGLLLWVLAFARAGRRAPGFAWALRLLAALRPWSMIEVCMLGILVAVIKLTGFVAVTADAGIWATAALMVLITVIASRDTQWLWALLPEDTAA